MNSRDVFSITIPVPSGTYPSVNHLGINGQRGGGKSREYEELFASVKEAALAEMARIGWTTAEYDVEGWFTRYHPRANVFDCSNAFKAEPDALEKAGVVANDTLIRPFHKSAQYDPIGPDRVVIVLQRLYPRITDVRAAAPPKSARKPKAKPPEQIVPPLSRRPSTGQTAQINGHDVPYGEAARLVREELARGSSRRRSR